MIIACDIDCVINDLMDKVLALYNSRNGKNIQMADITTYNFFDCLSYEDASAMEILFKDKELWDSLEPIPDSQWGIETLINSGHRVVFATATHACNFEWKCQWLSKHFNMVNANDVIRIMDKSLLRCDVMVDDCMDNLIKNPCERVCLDYPYNRDVRRDFIYCIRRAKNWREIVNIINSIEKENEEWKA